MTFLNNFNKNKNNKNKIKLFKNYLKIKNLKIGKNKNAGKNNQGKITVYHQGGGLKNNYIMLDILRDYIFFWAKPALVLSIEYDPNRTNYLSLILYNNGFLSYIPHIWELIIGKVITTSTYSRFIGCRYPLVNAHINQKYSQVLYFARAAGTFVKYLGLNSSEQAILILPSGKKKTINNRILATYGINSNLFHYTRSFYKAGQRRLLNIRPTVRGVAMNPVDHPHGGGEGKTSGGRISVTPWGIYTKGYKRIKNKKIYKKKQLKDDKKITPSSLEFFLLKNKKKLKNLKLFLFKYLNPKLIKNPTISGIPFKRWESKNKKIKKKIKKATIFCSKNWILYSKILNFDLSSFIDIKKDKNNLEIKDKNNLENNLEIKDKNNLENNLEIKDKNLDKLKRRARIFILKNKTECLADLFQTSFKKLKFRFELTYRRYKIGKINKINKQIDYLKKLWINSLKKLKKLLDKKVVIIKLQLKIYNLKKIWIKKLKQLKIKIDKINV